MSTSQDLMGHSMPYGLAGELGLDPSALTATGSTQAGAAPMLTQNVEMTATGADGIIPPTNAKVARPYFIFNSSGSTGVIYVPLNHYLNTTQNGTLSLVTHKACILYQYKASYWATILTA